jgi:hypothetical protein
MKTSRIKPLFILALLLFGLILIPQAHATTVTQTRSLGSSAYQFFTLNGAQYSNLRNLTTFDSFEYLEKYLSYTYDGNIQIGFRLWKNIYDVDYTYIDSYEELTSGTTFLFEEINSFEGWASAYWNCSELNITRLDSFQISFYARFRTTASNWNAWSIMTCGSSSIFITESLGFTRLLSSEWNFTFYLKCFRVTVPTPIKRYVRIYLGNSTYNSRIENMLFDNGVSEAAPLGLSFSSGVVFVGVLAACVCVVVLAAGLSLKKRR